jgi:phosphopantetheinyl transferase
MAASFAVEVHIWFQDTESRNPGSLAPAGQVLSQEELIRRDRFKFPEDRRDYAAAHHLLRQSLSMHTPARHPSAWHFEKDGFGKPHIVGAEREAPPIEFSLSHTRGFVACAISSARVGIDVEKARPNIDYEDIARDNFSHQEIQALNELPATVRTTRVLELWTLKEAFLKATGRGLSAQLDSVWFEFLPPGAIRFHAPGDVDVGSWKFALFEPHAEVRMAVAVESRGLPRVLVHGREAPDQQFAVAAALLPHWRSLADV